ncbi:major capsid protein [Ruegeria jejuensis]|uniref:major capsid protein n=1 Tax=Ruegeria jejuensis TaxID=3233338 RepID=UPI00355C7291
MALSNMQVFEQYAYGSATETIAQQVDLFNEATRGAITLVAAQNEGDYSTETFWKEIAGLTRRRDAYGSGAVAAVALAQEAHTGVKIAGGTPPIAFEPQQLSWIQKSPDEAGVVIGEQLGRGMVGDMINSAVRSAVAAVGNNAAVIHDGTAGTATRGGLVTAAGKFGDRMGDIVVWVLHSKVMTDLYGENLTNTNRLFDIGTIAVMEDGFGRPLVMTDSADLITTGTPDTYHTLGLSAGAVAIEDNGDLFTNIETSNGNENIARTFQAEYTFNSKVKGYSWDKANGGASPTDVELATGTNWDKVATDDKNTAGVLLNTQ